MPEIKINLEAILKSFLTVEAMKLNNPDYTFNMVLSAMKEACRQTVELVAEKAEVVEHEVAESIHGGPGYTYFTVDKQSILNTINQVI